MAERFCHPRGPGQHAAARHDRDRGYLIEPNDRGCVTPARF